jgi:hypothetical protein
VVAGRGVIVAELFDAGYSRLLAWADRPQAAALLAAVADPDRRFEAIVVGEYERVLHGDQLHHLLPLLDRYGVQLWLPETHGPLDPMYRLDPDRVTAPQVRWIFAQRLAGWSVASIARGLNERAVPCPSQADQARNPHRDCGVWTINTVASILANPRYTGRQVWNRQRTDPAARPGRAGRRRAPQRRNPIQQWAISKAPAHTRRWSVNATSSLSRRSAPPGPLRMATSAVTRWSD